MKKLYSLFIVLSCIPFTFGATRYWVGGTSGNWNTTASWSATSGGSSGASVPTTGDAVFFENGLTTAVTYDLPGADIGFAGFSVINNTQLILTNTITPTRSISITNVSSSYYEVVAAGSSLTLKSTTNSPFNFGSTALSSGRMVFNGDIKCINQAGNNSNGPRLVAQDSIIINALYYVGPSITQLGSNPSGSKFRFSNGSVYQLDKNNGVIPGGKYEPSSLIRVTGTTSGFPSTWNLPAIYGAVEFNSPAANSATVGNLALPANTVFQGDFRILSLGTSAGIRLASTPNNINIQGNMDVANGTLSLANSAVAGTVTLNGNLTQSAGTTIDLQNAAGGTTTFNVKGNLSSLGTITENGLNTAATIALIGTVSQNLSFASITKDVRFLVNNPAGLTVLNDWNMPNSANSRITLTAGNINLGTNTLHLSSTSTASLVGGTAASHIVGELRRAMILGQGAYSFPVSDNSADIATVNITPAVDGDYSIKFSRPNPFDRNAVSAPTLNAGNYIWDIKQFAGGAVDLNFEYGGFDNGGITDPGTVRGLHWNGTSWDNLGGSDGGGNSVNVSGVTIFSPTAFSLGSEVAILPITIEYFKGIKSGNFNDLSWKVTCTNTPAVTLTLERSSDGRSFKNIYSITTNAIRCQQSFNESDKYPAAGFNFYRLKVTDANGKVKYSTVVSLLNNTTGFNILSLVPNPVETNGTTTLNLLIGRAGQVQILITDVSGKNIETYFFPVQSGDNRITLRLSNLAAGTYQLTVLNEDGQKITTRLFKK